MFVGYSSFSFSRCERNVEFINMGFRKWKDSSNLLEKHSQSERHANAISWLNFKAANSKKDSSIKDKLDANRSKEVEANRKHVKCLLHVTSLLGRQVLAFVAMMKVKLQKIQEKLNTLAGTN